MKVFQEKQMTWWWSWRSREDVKSNLLQIYQVENMNVYTKFHVSRPKVFYTFLLKSRAWTMQWHWWKVGLTWCLGTTNPCKNVCVNPSHRREKNWSTTKVSGIYPLGSVPNFMAIHPDLVWTKLVDWPSDSLTLPKKLKKELW